jgi:hypothetical protein
MQRSQTILGEMMAVRIKERGRRRPFILNVERLIGEVECVQFSGSKLISGARVSRRIPKIKSVIGCTYGSFRQGVGKMEEHKQVHTKSGHLLEIRVK